MKFLTENTIMKNIFTQIYIAILSLSASIVLAAVIFWPTSLHAQTIPVTPQQIDELANKSDRWLFIAALILLLGFGAVVVKWLLAQLDKQREANQLATDKLITHLQNESSAARASLDKNTIALERNSNLLAKGD